MLAATTALTAPADDGSPERPKRSGGPAQRVDAPPDGVVRFANEIVSARRPPARTPAGPTPAHSAPGYTPAGRDEHGTL